MHPAGRNHPYGTEKQDRDADKFRFIEQKQHSRPSWSREFRASMGLFFNFNFQSGLKFHSEVVIPDDNTRKPALYQGLVVGLFTIGLFEKLFLEALQFFVDPISILGVAEKVIAIPAAPGKP